MVVGHQVVQTNHCAEQSVLQPSLSRQRQEVALQPPPRYQTCTVLIRLGV